MKSWKKNNKSQSGAGLLLQIQKSLYCHLLKEISIQILLFKKVIVLRMGTHLRRLMKTKAWVWEEKHTNKIHNHHYHHHP